MRGQMMHYPLLLNTLLERANMYSADVEIVSLGVKQHTRYTYSDLYKRSNNLARALIRLGVKPGDRVGTLMSNHSIHLEALFGIPRSGAVVHAINFRQPHEQIAYMVRHVKDKVLIVDNALLPLLKTFLDTTDVDKILVVEGDAALSEPFHDYEDFISNESDCVSAWPTIDENDAAAISFTSGTTGVSKGVVYSHRSLVLHSMALAMVDAYGINHRDVLLHGVPFYHVNGWGLPYAATMMGVKQVLTGTALDPLTLSNAMQTQGTTVATGVFTVWSGVLNHLKNGSCSTSKLNMRLIIGGTNIPETFVSECETFGLQIIHSYGMTETSPVFATGTLNQFTPLPLCDVRLQDDQDKVPWDGYSQGELQVRGHWVAESYYNLPGIELTTPDGWLHTGDIATINKSVIKIVDRKKDLIKSGGEWISSVDLENHIMGHPSVIEAAVVGVPHSKWQERPVAVIVLEDGYLHDSEVLSSWLEERVPKFWIPDHYIVVASIPKTSVGKFDKKLLRASMVNSITETI